MGSSHRSTRNKVLMISVPLLYQISLQIFLRHAAEMIMRKPRRHECYEWQCIRLMFACYLFVFQSMPPNYDAEVDPPTHLVGDQGGAALSSRLTVGSNFIVICSKRKVAEKAVQHLSLSSVSLRSPRIVTGRSKLRQIPLR